MLLKYQFPAQNIVWQWSGGVFSGKCIFRIKSSENQISLVKLISRKMYRGRDFSFFCSRTRTLVLYFSGEPLLCRLAMKSLRQEEEVKVIHLKKHALEMVKSTHTCTKQAKEDEIVCMISDKLRKCGNWDSLSCSIDSIELTEPLVEKILLELKEPNDAKRALSFFHWSARIKNFVHSARSYCIIVQILVRARSLVDARALLESVIRKNAEGGFSGFTVLESLLSTYRITLSTPFLFDFLIQTYAKLRMFELAFDACRCLEEQGFSSSLISFNTLIHVVQKSDRNDMVWKIYEYMIGRRTYPNEITVRIMTSAMCKEGTLQKFVDILDRIHGNRCTPGVIVNTTLVFRIFGEKRVEEGIFLLKRMLQKNIILDDIAYSLILYAHCKMGNLKLAYESFDEMIKKGYHANSFIFTSIIGLHCEEGRIEEANHMIKEMKLAGLKPFDETYNFLIEGCSKVGSLEESLIFYDEMLEGGFLPSCVACNEMVSKLCEAGDVKKANDIITVLLDKGFLPDEATYSYLIDGYGKVGNYVEVLKLYYEMEYKGPSPGLMTYTSLIRSLCQCQKLKEAEKYLTVMQDRSLTPTIYIYETLIGSHCEKGDIDKALNLYNEMNIKELKPSSHSLEALNERINDASNIQDADRVLDRLKA